MNWSRVGVEVLLCSCLGSRTAGYTLEIEALLCPTVSSESSLRSGFTPVLRLDTCVKVLSILAAPGCVTALSKEWFSPWILWVLSCRVCLDRCAVTHMPLHLLSPGPCSGLAPCWLCHP
jgi:hypothetical protein